MSSESSAKRVRAHGKLGPSQAVRGAPCRRGSPTRMTRAWRHWRVAEPLPKGAASRACHTKADHSCLDTARSTGSAKAAHSYPDKAAHSCPAKTKNTGSSAAEQSCLDTANRTESVKSAYSCPTKAEYGCPVNASRNCPAKTNRGCTAKGSRERLAKANLCEFCPLALSKDKTRKPLAKASRWYSIGQEVFRVMGLRPHEWRVRTNRRWFYGVPTSRCAPA